jgi:agmatine deiminase
MMVHNMHKTPASFGFRMPAEWEPHAATWLAWPYNMQTWEGHLEGAEDVFTMFIRALLPHENIHLLVPNEEVKRRAQMALKTLPDKSSLHLHMIEAGDIWFRDFGPLFIVQEREKHHEVAWTKWIYNAYGKKYDDLLIGNDVTDHMPLEELKRFDAGIVLEGGSIDVNGTGSLLTTESCLLSPDRNPDISREDIERTLQDFLGVTNILWLSRGIAGDDTTGHIDDVTRFVAQSRVVTMVEEDPQDENYTPLRENLERLHSMKDEEGGALEVIELPMPKKFYVDNRRMAASYANFYIANGVVLVPVYDQPSDAIALDVLRQVFPDREVRGLDCRELIFGYGALHCMTMQQPR